MVEERATPVRSISIFTVISFILLLAVLLGTGGLFLYRESIKKSILEKENSLNLAKNSFEPSKLTELQLLDKRLKASTEILDKHVAVTPVFQALSEITMKTVRYTKFDYTLGTDKDAKNTSVTIKMSGTAVGYRSVALQSDLFALNKNLIDPVFSNLTLDDKGNVLFDLEFTVDPSFVNYKKILATES